MDCVIRQVAGHVEVYSHSGVFLFSADSTREAMQEPGEEGAKGPFADRRKKPRLARGAARPLC